VFGPPSQMPSGLGAANKTRCQEEGGGAAAAAAALWRTPLTHALRALRGWGLPLLLPRDLPQPLLLLVSIVRGHESMITG